MISIRNGMFETNSSSAHTYIIDKDHQDDGLVIPSKIKLGGHYDPAIPEDRVKFIYDILCSYNKEGAFIDWLESKGIEIEDIHEDSTIEESLSILGLHSEHELELVCFNPDLISEDDRKYNEIIHTLPTREFCDKFLEIDIKR